MPICPKCKQRFEGKPNFCPHCGAKFNWPAPKAPEQAAPAPAPRPAPRPARPSDDDMPIDTRQYQQARARRQPIYALVAKILMISFCGAGLLFLTIGLICFFGPFLAGDSGLPDAFGFALAFNFGNDALKSSGYKLTEGGANWIVPMISLAIVGALIGLSIPRLLKDIKFFRAKENTRAVQKRRNKAVFNLILYCSLALAGIITIAIIKATTNFISGVSDGYNLGGGAIANIVFLVFFIGFTVAEEVIVLTMLHIGPRRPRYVEPAPVEEEMPEIE